MITDLALRWITTGLFGFGAANVISRLVRAGSWISRVDHTVHLAMCTAMILMAWPRNHHMPLGFQGAFFSVATVWFGAIAVRRARASRHEPVGVPGHEPMTIRLYYALMMAAMVWMVAVMAHWSLRQGHRMRMSGQAMIEAPRAEMSMGPIWTTSVSAVLTAIFATAAAMWLYRSFAQWKHWAKDPARYAVQIGNTVGAAQAVVTDRVVPMAEPASLLCNAAMAAGMAIMLETMS
ncbi:DUF5134 domain-containing protein [Nocardia alni]|uniref:DUF5134 domain-containing protein n=1 Tax=Nocardia alni TaxID=2815723 RepID=UPI001C21254B|nr:DUF5134 domain-containing protein [Nocardia alni]